MGHEECHYTQLGAPNAMGYGNEKTNVRLDC